jgi:hypothetical protein
MTLSGAERQARWRARKAAELAALRQEVAQARLRALRQKRVKPAAKRGTEGEHGRT